MFCESKTTSHIISLGNDGITNVHSKTEPTPQDDTDEPTQDDSTTSSDDINTEEPTLFP